MPYSLTWGGQSCPQPPFRLLSSPANSRLQPGLAAHRALQLRVLDESIFFNPLVLALNSFLLAAFTAWMILPLFKLK
jgi:hypothetical protein